MIDSHCHLADDAFIADVASAVRRAREAGLVGALCVIDASDEAEIARVPSVCALWDGIRTTAGVHPHKAAPFGDDVRRMEALVRSRVAADPLVRAIGEIGLDYHYDFAPRDVQVQVFAAQVALARELGLPIVIHTREAGADTLRVIDEAGRGEVRGVFHCFSGDTALAAAAVERGFHVSFSGIVTFPKAADVRAAAAAVPLDRLLVETDCPYLAPVPRRGARNEPAWVVHVAREVGAIRGIELSVVAAAVTANYVALFRP